MKRVLTIFCAVALVVTAAGCRKTYSLAGVADSVPTISVQGKGMVEAVPDEATVSFGVASDDKALANAYKENTARINAVISVLKEMGIDAKDIRTSSFRVSPVYPRDENGRPIPGKPASFNVTQQLTVTVRDISETGGLIDKVMFEGVNTFNGLSFGSSRIESIEAEAKVKAARDAREKAESLAGALGVKLGRVLKVSEDPVRPSPARTTLQYEAMAMRAAPQIEAGTIQVSATCGVIFAIEQ